MAVATVDKVSVRKSGLGESTGFDIMATAEAFRILSDGLYSDKPTAAARELGTNMYDAHVAANTLHKPPIVHVPTSSEPWFSGRDFGPGLGYIVYEGDKIAPDYSNVVYGPAQLDECEVYWKSRGCPESVKVVDEVHTIYTTYFLSTKTKSNDFVGQLGLGSKSPLAVTDTFTVVSYFNGIKRHYLCFLNEERLPEVDHLKDQDEETDEPNGLFVKFAVRSYDCNEFQQKIAQVYRHFSHRPEFTGKELTIPNTTFILQKGDWGIYSSEPQYSGAKAIMGNICYPLNGSKIKDLSDKCSRLLKNDIEIKFPVGALDITPSREQLSYGKATQAAIVAKLEEILVEVNAEVEKQFVECKTLWEARCLANDMYLGNSAKLGTLGRLADVPLLEWQGTPIGTPIQAFSEIGGIEAWEYKRESRRHSWYTEDEIDRKGTIKKHKVQQFAPTNRNVGFYEVDIPRGSFSRCRALLEERKVRRVCLVKFETAEAKASFLEKMGMDGSELTPTSTLPKLPANRGVFHSCTSQVFSHDGSTDYLDRFYDYWSEDAVDLADGGVYCEICRYQARRDGRIIHPREVGQIMSRLKACGYEVPEVIGVRPGVAKKFRKSDDWVDIWTYAKEVLRADAVKRDLARHISNAEEMNRFGRRAYYTLLIDKITDPTSVMKAFLDKLKQVRDSGKKTPNYSAYTDLAGLVNYKLTAGKRDHDLVALEKAIKKDYPFWESFIASKENHYSSDDISRKETPAVVQYIKLVDKHGAGPV